MLDLYSLNVDVAANGAIPLNNSKITKGVTAVHNAPATIELNKSGVYMVSCNASITPAAAGIVRIQLAQNNVLDLSSFSEATGAAAQITDLSFTTLVQVRDNNTCCCNTAPTTLQLINAGEAGTFSIVRVTVTKLC